MTAKRAKKKPAPTKKTPAPPPPPPATGTAIVPASEEGDDRPGTPTGPDWPATLNSEKADALFRKIEAGVPRSRAPAEVGLAWRTVARWISKHKDFRERIEEAEVMGHQSIIDGWMDISKEATDKESAAAAKAKVDIQDRYLQRTAPHRYNVRLIHHGLMAATKANGGRIAAVGLVIVPMKVSGRGLPPTDPIEGVATRVIVPPKAASTPHEEVITVE